MANINLKNVFKQQVPAPSKVDSNIKLNQQMPVVNLYSDIKLDLSINENKSGLLNSDITSKDIEIITNEEAVLTSLKNILNTKFYSRILNPEMNFDLRTYLFEEQTEAKAFFIGYDISNLLPAYEPRVVVSNVEVTAYISSDTYLINLSIYIPSINKNTKLSSVLSGDGFTFT